MSTRLRRAFIVALALVVGLGGLAGMSALFADEAGAQAASIPCDGTPYTTQDGRLFTVLPDPTSADQYLFNEVGLDDSYGNSLAFDPFTQLLYGTERIDDAWVVETYDAGFATINAVPIFGAAGGPEWPPTSLNYAATVLGDGRYIVATYGNALGGDVDGSKYNLWSLDAATGEATYIAPLAPQLSHADFAYNPADGFLYAVRSSQLWQIDPLDGTQVALGPIGGTVYGGSFGSSYFDADGNLFVHKNNQGHLLRISGIATGNYTGALVGTAPPTLGSDGASCVVSGQPVVSDDPGTTAPPDDATASDVSPIEPPPVITGELVISKKIEGLPRGLDPALFPSTIDVTCAGDFDGGSMSFPELSLSTGAPVVLTDLPAGAVCSMSEHRDPRFRRAYPLGQQITIVEGPNQLRVVNRTSTFQIQISTIGTDGVHPDGTFTFTYSCNDGLDTSGAAQVTTVGRIGRWTFDDGAPLLPPYTTCTFVQSPLSPGWTTSHDTVQVTLNPIMEAGAWFVNWHEPEPGTS